MSPKLPLAVTWQECRGSQTVVGLVLNSCKSASYGIFSGDLEHRYVPLERGKAQIPIHPKLREIPR